MKGLSLMETLKLVPPEIGLKVEASVDYYETLRMARIFNHTYNDPYSLNIDLDQFMADYSNTMRYFYVSMFVLYIHNCMYIYILYIILYCIGCFYIIWICRYHLPGWIN